VVLGIRSYDQVLGDAHAQTVQSALALMKSFLFVGCGDGLGDPNFGALRQWMKKVFPGAEYRHFRMCRDGETDKIQKFHPPEERIFALGYGAGNSDLAPFLRRLKQPIAAAPPSRPETGEPAPLPPRPARIFGRDQLVEDLVTTLLLDTPPPVAVLGGPGFGKSTLCLAALHDRRVAARFGARRWFVRCDAATTREEVLKEIALVLGLDVGPSLEPRVFAALSETPCVLVIDNAETPWWGAPLPTEDLLGRLSEVSGLALIAAIRGQQRPYGPAWREPSLSVAPLDFGDSRKVFLAIAGEKHATERHLADLLGALDGIPLAIELLAHAAEAEPNLEGLWRRWQQERTALLRRADGSTRLVNAAVSFELSISGPRMTDEARQLLSVLAVLPDGIAHQDLPAVIPGHPDRAAATLRQLGLAFDQADRLRVLAPIREHVVTSHSPSSEVLAPMMAHFIGLVQDLGSKVGQTGGEDAVRRLAADARNVEATLSKALARPDSEEFIGAVLRYGEFQRWSGFGTPGVLERARQIAGTRGNTLLEAGCLRSLGEIALVRADYDTARAHFEEAQTLSQKIGNVHGVARCVEGLGDIALTRLDYDTARDRYEEAQPLYQEIVDVLGVANCMQSLGDIARHRADHETARTHYEQAQKFYQQLGNVLGVANCIQGLGEIALALSDRDTARARFQEALTIYERIQQPYSIGNAHWNLLRLAATEAERKGHIAAAREAYRSIQREDLVQRLDEEFSA
jgi:tetratricopeptide (TPR) repeat protein